MKTNYLLAGEGAGQKLERAREHGTRVLFEHDFLAMLDSLDGACRP